MVKWRHLAPCVWGEKQWFEQWSVMRSTFSASTLETTRQKGHYDFADVPGDRGRWGTSGTVNFDDRGALLEENTSIYRTTTFPAHWKVTFTVDNEGWPNEIRVGVRVFGIGTQHLRPVRTFRGRVTLESTSEGIFLRYGTRKVMVAVASTSVDRVIVRTQSGRARVSAAWISFERPDVMVDPLQRNVSITDFDTSTNPQAAILSEKKESTVAEAFDDNPVFSGQQSLHFDTSEEGEYYSLDVGEAPNVSARLRVDSASHFTVGFDGLKIEIDGDSVVIIDGSGRVVHENELPSETETIIVNFTRFEGVGRCRLDLEDPVDAAPPDTPHKWVIGASINHGNLGSTFSIQNQGASNLYLDYILCGDMQWEHFM